MKNKLFLTAIPAIALVIGLSMTVMGCDDPGDDDNGKHWLISHQGTYTYTAQDGIVDENHSTFSSTSYSWIAYRYRDGTDYEEEYTTMSSLGYSEYHNTRNGQTSHSTTETISLSSDTVVSLTTSSTTASYDLESGLTSSYTTVSSGGTATTYYSIELLIDLKEEKTYKHTPLGNNWYNIIKIKDGRTLETSYYNESGLIYTTTYIYPDNAEIRERLPNFTLYSTRYHSSSYSINNSYQTAEVLEKSDSYLEIRVRTFNDGVLGSRTDYTYRKINPGEQGEPPYVSFTDVDGMTTWFETKRWGDFWYGERDGIILICGWTGTGSNVVIPAQINGKPVTGIGDHVFTNRYKLASVTIPNSVTSIGRSAFDFCWSLAGVTIPNVISIGESAFRECYSLASVTIGNSVTSIGDYAFANCRRLASITIPNGVTSIGDYAFSGTGLTSITIPNSVPSIGEQAFYGCQSLASVTIGNSVTSIGDYAFSGTGLTSITIPNSVTSIGKQAFYCDSLTSVTIGNSVTSIGDYAFYWGNNLISVTFQGTIPPAGIGYAALDSGLEREYLAGGPGTYTRDASSGTWTKQD